MKYKEGDKLRVITPEFQKIFAGQNVWVVDHIKTQISPYPSLYVCYRENDKHRVLYNFLEKEVVRETRTLEEIANSIV
jgi:hypothetical protein